VAFTSRSGHTQTALAEINITPLVDVVLVLLVIFMLTAPVLQSGIQVNVPKTKTVREITEQRTVITIDKDQQVFLNDKLVNLNDLPNILRSQSSDNVHQVIYLRADQSVSFGAFATLMDAVKQAGITNVSIVTQPAENATKK
jgi:biopolymer transport protein TolR